MNVSRLISIIFVVFPTLVLAQKIDSALGSKQNPVRAFMPVGEREYLMRLRCPDGKEPEYERLGSFGKGPYGNIIDGYQLTCGEKVSENIVFIDMYHRGHRELEPVPGYTILADIPALVAEGCPPKVPGYKEGTYLFRPLEVEKPPKPHFDLKQKVAIGEKGRVYAEFVIDITGKVEADSLNILYLSDDSLRTHATQYFYALEFDPAEHHPGCFVPFKAQLGVNFE